MQSLGRPMLEKSIEKLLHAHQKSLKFARRMIHN